MRHIAFNILADVVLLSLPPLSFLAVAVVSITNVVYV